MKTFITVIEYLLIVLSTLFPAAFTPDAKAMPYEAAYQNLGIPLAEYYPEGIPARTAWDVEIYEDKLFVASGDYDRNMGPVQIYYYHIPKHKWIHSGAVSDEQIEQFYVIDGKLMAPGCDPKQDWTFGNLYQFQEEQWITHRTIPGGIHQFDMTQFDGKLFVALGVSPGQYPIAVSEDGGSSFRQLPMYKDGVPLDTSIPQDQEVTSMQVRAYDFFTLHDKLYVFYYIHINSTYSMEIYEYRDDGFHYHSDLPASLSYRRISFEIFRAKAETERGIYFSTGKLYRSTDMMTAEEIVLEENAIVTDLRMIRGKLYVLTSTLQEDGRYQTGLWVKQPFSTDSFQKLFYFTFDSPAQSFTCQDSVFYFGMGDGTLSETEDTNGTVLAVKYPAS